MSRSRTVLPAALIVLSLALAGCGGKAGADCPGISQPVTSGPGSFDNDDGKTTTQRGPIRLGGAGCGGTLTTENADNWTFEGKANQTIVINVAAKGDSDPDLTVIDENGDMLDSNDDVLDSNGDNGGNHSSMLVDTLPDDGVYTLRVDAYVEGGYTITVQEGTPAPVPTDE